MCRCASLASAPQAAVATHITTTMYGVKVKLFHVKALCDFACERCDMNKHLLCRIEETYIYRYT